MVSASDNPGEESPEHMRYGMLGEDMSSLDDKLAKYSGRAAWADLKTHLGQATLIYVDPSLNLTEVGRAFAADEKSRVEAWMKSGDLVVPSEPHGVYWESTNAVFECQVVSPFVLIQPVKE